MWICCGLRNQAALRVGAALTEARRPRIVHVYKDYYPPVIGGVEQSINLMATGLRDRYDVRVLVCEGRSGPGVGEIEGVTVIRAREWGRVLSAPISPGFVGALAREAAAADLLHFHHPNPTGDLAHILSRSRVPAVMTYHSDIVRQRMTGFLLRPLQSAMMRRMRLIMPTSPNYIESSRWLRQFRDKCRVVPLGIGLERFRATDAVTAAAQEIRSRLRGPLVIFVGRLRYYKGVEFLVRAAAKVDATILVVGTGPEGPRLHQLAAELGVGERVQFLGDLSDEEVVHHLHASDVFCLPSHLRSEAFGLSQVEAMACGLPVVSARLDTGVTFVNQHMETGLCVESASAEALAAGLNRLIEDEALRKALGRRALERTHELFSAENMCRGVAAVYDEALGRIPGPGV